MHAWLHSLLTSVTDIGDSAVLLALVVTGALYLLSRGCHRAAWALALSFCAACLLIAIVKMFFLGCRTEILSDVHSPSGHAALSVAVFGSYALVIGTRLHGWKRRLAQLLLVTLAILIAFSRVPLGFHSVSEVLIGLLVGAAAVFLARFILRAHAGTPPFDVHVLALWLLVVALLFHGIRLPAEELIRLFASGLKAHTPVCRLFQ